MLLNLILFRHGESYHNLDRIFSGWSETSLTPKGIHQAKRLAEIFRNEKIDVGFTSGQLRSMQTLAEILVYHPSAKVIIDKRIRERNYGDLTGKNKDEFAKKNIDLFKQIHRGYFADVPNGENFFQVSKRVFSFMDELISFMQKEKVNVALSLHGNSMRLAIQYLEKLSNEQTELLELSTGEYKKYWINV